MTRLAWGLVVALAFVLAVNVLQGRDAESYNRAERERLAAETRAVQHTVDTLKARHAEREVRDERHADSLRALVTRYRRNTATVITRADTVLVPIQEFVYVRDTLLPACEACAARLDSAVSASRAERRAFEMLVESQRAQIEWWVRHDKPHHALATKLVERVGLYVGYGGTAVGGQAFVGPQLGLGLRLVP